MIFKHANLLLNNLFRGTHAGGLNLTRNDWKFYSSIGRHFFPVNLLFFIKKKFVDKGTLNQEVIPKVIPTHFAHSDNYILISWCVYETENPKLIKKRFLIN